MLHGSWRHPSPSSSPEKSGDVQGDWGASPTSEKGLGIYPDTARTVCYLLTLFALVIIIKTVKLCDDARGRKHGLSFNFRDIKEVGNLKTPYSDTLCGEQDSRGNAHRQLLGNP